MRNDFHLELRAALIGIEIMATSGTFCMAIPRATAMALASEMLDAPHYAPAKTTPTAIPSGRLWMVTAEQAWLSWTDKTSCPPVCPCRHASAESVRLSSAGNPFPTGSQQQQALPINIRCRLPFPLRELATTRQMRPPSRPKRSRAGSFAAAQTSRPFLIA